MRKKDVMTLMTGAWVNDVQTPSHVRGIKDGELGMFNWPQRSIC